MATGRPAVAGSRGKGGVREMPENSAQVSLPAHNGWPNYPTWCVFTWLTNDDVIYVETQYALETADERGLDKAKALQIFVEELVNEMVDGAANLASNLAGWALEFVDWNELAKAFDE